jgi:hypothetical protein
VLGNAGENAPRNAQSFTAKVTVLNSLPDLVIVESYAPVIWCNAARVVCAFTKLHRKVFKPHCLQLFIIIIYLYMLIFKMKVQIRTEVTIEANPTKLQPGDTAIVTLVPPRVLCVFPSLSFAVQGFYLLPLLPFFFFPHTHFYNLIIKIKLKIMDVRWQ